MTTNVETAIGAGVANAVLNPNVPIDPMTAPKIIHEVVKEVKPVVDHLTNNEPWYRSRVTWGAIGAIVLPLLGVFGVTTDVIDNDTFVALGLATGTVISGFLTLYGRWKATRPIGK